jgi:hypothetical protein
MSDTPRTDEWLAEEKRNPRLSGLGPWLGYCQQLERELTKAKEQRDRLAKEVENLQAAQIHTCHDQCQKPMCAMRRQRDTVAEALGELIRLDDQMNDPDYEESGTYAGAYYCYYKGERDTWDNAREALAAVKGATP